MNHSTARVAGIVSPVLAAAAPRALSAVPLARETRLDLLRGMLCRLQDVTPAGQHYLMAKVLPLLRREATDRGQRFRSPDREVITRSLDELEREAARMAPDPAIFSGKAQMLVDVFALA